MNSKAVIEWANKAHRDRDEFGAIRKLGEELGEFIEAVTAYKTGKSFLTGLGEEAMSECMETLAMNAEMQNLLEVDLPEEAADLVMQIIDILHLIGCPTTLEDALKRKLEINVMETAVSPLHTQTGDGETSLGSEEQSGEV